MTEETTPIIRKPYGPVISIPTKEPQASHPRHERPVLHSNWFFILIFVAIIICMIFGTINGDFDNDMWWLLATGRDIVQNGIPQTNPWTMFDGLGVVVQQWLAAVILYGAYAVFGYMGLKYLVLIQCLVLLLVMFAACRVVSARNIGSGELFAFALAIAFLAFSAYLSVRPHVYSMILYAVVIIIMEKYRQTSNVKWLIALPFVTCLHVNLHAAMAPFDLFIVALYLIPDIPAMLQGAKINTHGFKFNSASYKRLPVLVALIIAAAALLLNPYGIKGAAYLLLSYETAGYGDYINEMGTTGFWTNYGAGAMGMIVLGAIAIGRNGIKRFDLPLTVLFAVSIPLSMVHVRNVWLVAFFGVFLFAKAFSGITLNLKPIERYTSSKALNILLMLVVLIGATINCANNEWIEDVANAELDSQNTPSAAMDTLDTYVAEHGIQKSTLRIYNSFNNGGYIEWRGYRVFMDARPELWEPNITGVDVHYYKDFVDTVKGTANNTNLLDKYDFDFCIAYSNSDMSTSLSTNRNYEKVMTGEGYSLWARKDLQVTADTSAGKTTPSEISSSNTNLAA